MAKYKNITGQKLLIPNIGEVEPEGIIESDVELHNEGLAPLSDTPVQSVQPPVDASMAQSQPQPEQPAKTEQKTGEDN